jgi:hypothetical protein
VTSYPVTGNGAYVAATPDPQVTTLVAALLRHLLTIASGAGITVGAVNDSAIAVVASGIVGAATVGWSIWQKIRAARADHAGSVRSAQTGQAVKAT